MLVVAVLGCLAIRVILPWSSIFSSGHVNFSGPDSYYHMSLIRGILQAGFSIASAIHYPYDTGVVGFVWLVSLGNSSLSLLEHVAVFIPPFLAILTMVTVYIITRVLFSPLAGLVAAFALALLPGEFLGRTILGAVDHHAAEIFLSTGIIMFLVLMEKDLLGRQKDSLVWRSPILLFGAAVLFFIYRCVWIGYPLMVPVFLLFLAVAFSRNAIFDILLMFLVGIAMLSLASKGLPLKLSSLTLATTSEAAHGWTSYLVLLHILLSGMLAYLAVKFGDRFKYALAGWLLLLMGFTLWQERFDYYLAVPMAIMLGVTLGKVYCSLRLGSLNYKKVWFPCVLFVLLAIIIFPVYIINLPQKEYYTPPDDWYSALIWVRDNTPDDARVITWWDYGYWVEYIAERSPICTPSQRSEDVIAVARFFNSDSGEQLPSLPQGVPLYVIIDKATAFDFMPAIRRWADGEITSYPLAEKLYLGLSPEGFKLVYSNPSVKIYREEH